MIVKGLLDIPDSKFCIRCYVFTSKIFPWFALCIQRREKDGHIVEVKKP